MAKYCVCVDGDQDEINKARAIEAESLQDAAETYVRLNFVSLDFPDEIEVWVKQAGSTVMPVKYSVVAIREVRFSAKSVE